MPLARADSAHSDRARTAVPTTMPASASSCSCSMRCSRNGLFTKKKARSAAGVPTMDASQKSPRLDVLPCENVSVNTTASPQATAKPHPTSTRWLRENRSLAKYVCCCSCLFIPPPDRLHCRPWDGKNLIT